MLSPFTCNHVDLNSTDHTESLLQCCFFVVVHSCKLKNTLHLHTFSAVETRSHALGRRLTN